MNQFIPRKRSARTRSCVRWPHQADRIAEEALVMRYNRQVRICARPYFVAGGDSEDLIQEGMVGLLAAIRELIRTDNRSGSHLRTGQHQNPSDLRN